jgi:hypothetical protein
MTALSGRAVALPLLLAGFLLAGSTGAAAQTVYRCGADGRTYQTTPCNGGRTVDVDDPRSDEQRRAAREATASDARLAAQLERDRHAREAAAAAAARANSIAMMPGPAASTVYAPHLHGRRHARGPRYFADGTPVPMVYRVPAASAAPGHRKSR